MAKDESRGADFIGRVVSDPKEPPATRLLTGWLGDAGEEGYKRLYTDAELNAWVDIPDDAILHTEPIRDSQPAGAVFVWVERDAQLKPGGSTAGRAAQYLTGQVQQDYASGGGGELSLEKLGYRCVTQVPCGEPTGFTGQCTKQPEVGGGWPCITLIPHCAEPTGFTGKCTHLPWPNPTRYLGCTFLHCPTFDLTCIPQICHIVATGLAGCQVADPGGGGEPGGKEGEPQQRPALPPTVAANCGYTQWWGLCETQQIHCNPAKAPGSFTPAGLCTQQGCGRTAATVCTQIGCGGGFAGQAGAAAADVGGGGGGFVRVTRNVGCESFAVICPSAFQCPTPFEPCPPPQTQMLPTAIPPCNPQTKTGPNCPTSVGPNCHCPTSCGPDCQTQQECCTRVNCTQMGPGCLAPAPAPQPFAAAGPAGQRTLLRPECQTDWFACTQFGPQCPQTHWFACTQFGPQCPTYPSGDCTFFGCAQQQQPQAAAARPIAATWQCEPTPATVCFVCPPFSQLPQQCPVEAAAPVQGTVLWQCHPTPATRCLVCPAPSIPVWACPRPSPFFHCPPSPFCTPPITRPWCGGPSAVDACPTRICGGGGGGV